MRLDQPRVELRPRSPWEAMELGTALVRTHARAIWLPWLLVTLPVFAVVNAIGWFTGLLPWMGLAMWWLKPVFDRIPLFVLSQSLFGEAPGVRATLAAQRTWAWRAMPAYLTWRRLGPTRALYLPVDLLEGGANPGPRRRVIGGSVRGTAFLSTLVCIGFEAALLFGAYALVMVFVPVEFMSESARAMWALLTEEPPPWVHLAGNAVAWLAVSLIEPFYVGAGFGLYLDRRTQIEGWDIEIAFRRMRRRLQALLPLLLVACVLGLSMPKAAQAQQAPTTPADAAPTPTPKHAPKPAAKTDNKKSSATQPPTLPMVFPQVQDPARFDKAVERAYADPLLSPKRTDKHWERRKPAKPGEPRKPGKFPAIFGKIIAAIGEYGLWLLAALLVGLVVVSHRQWWPWLRGIAPPPRSAATPVASEPHLSPDALPDDIAGAARQLWQDGRKRRALALLYRASVAGMVARTGAVLVPGATEAECLRAARGLRDQEDRDAFGRMVRVWQYAAYAERLPDDGDFEGLLAGLGGRFGWAA
ncbi:DUF4129 domain-containing protein [Thermomonas carbonis]|uniref:DUF4129 domain-containing protein n=1 Tax=Thermomonas carbonis TaxID=1463158 RepID=A0A7G9SSN0_9GAMM|nr:DUF4129 domain-containing protein [Thermomonas carbonis]QNN70855.1 DUF4129 domain-containing protein [Thermomonas carbonis]GHC02880.1 membrane protein [Thermomonas carbonis]